MSPRDQLKQKETKTFFVQPLPRVKLESGPYSPAVKNLFPFWGGAGLTVVNSEPIAVTKAHYPGVKYARGKHNTHTAVGHRRGRVMMDRRPFSFATATLRPSHAPSRRSPAQRHIIQRRHVSILQSRSGNIFRKSQSPPEADGWT